jgi:hypothetical protein
MADTAIGEIADYHNDVVYSLKLYFDQLLRIYASDFRIRAAIANRLTARLEETDQRSAFFILASLEAAFRIDYECRCQKKLKDDLSRAFRAIWKSHKTRVSLDQDIFEAWKEHSSGSGPLIAELRSAFNFRHWLAHGSYWVPKLGRTYDFTFIYSLADDVLSAFPLQKFD